MLEFLEESSIQPGHVGVITAASPDGTMTVEIDGHHVGVGAFAERPHPRHHVIRGALCAFGAVVMATTGCGTTTVDPSIAASVDTGVTTTLPPISADASLVFLVRSLADSMRHLDEQVIEGDTDEATLMRIEEIWVRAEPLARERGTEFVFGLQQSIDLARTAVERTRPADASKGYKIVADLLARLD